MNSDKCCKAFFNDVAEIPLLFGEKNLKAVCFDSFHFKSGPAPYPIPWCNAQERSPSDMVLGFLARNELLASAFRVIFTG
jgi:hypothetical protein